MQIPSSAKIKLGVLGSWQRSRKDLQSLTQTPADVQLGCGEAACFVLQTLSPSLHLRFPGGKSVTCFWKNENISSSKVSICLPPTEPPGTVTDGVLRSLVPEWEAAAALMSPIG